MPNKLDHNGYLGRSNVEFSNSVTRRQWDVLQALDDATCAQCARHGPVKAMAACAGLSADAFSVVLNTLHTLGFVQTTRDRPAPQHRITAKGRRALDDKLIRGEAAA